MFISFIFICTFSIFRLILNNIFFYYFIILFASLSNTYLLFYIFLCSVLFSIHYFDIPLYCVYEVRG